MRKEEEKGKMTVRVRAGRVRYRSRDHDHDRDERCRGWRVYRCIFPDIHTSFLRRTPHRAPNAASAAAADLKTGSLDKHRMYCYA